MDLKGPATRDPRASLARNKTFLLACDFHASGCAGVGRGLLRSPHPPHGALRAGAPPGRHVCGLLEGSWVGASKRRPPATPRRTQHRLKTDLNRH